MNLKQKIEFCRLNAAGKTFHHNKPASFAALLPHHKSVVAIYEFLPVMR
jgi:hypothetical protein